MRLLLKITEGGMSAPRFNTLFWKIAATTTFTAREWNTSFLWQLYPG